MLYDPKWEAPTETKADPFSLESLIAWLEKQPAECSYDWQFIPNCLLGQWARAMGVSGEYAILNRSKALGMSTPFSGIALFSPCTFGAALERARKALNTR